MANPDHVRLLQRGSDYWNAWREQFPNEQPDLESADLSGGDLQCFNFSAGNLQRVNLTCANLRCTNLNGADLRRARLAGAWLDQGVQLRGAKLWLARLEEAQLSNADLSEADMVGAIFHRARLDNAILEHVEARQADFNSAYMAKVRLDFADLHECNFMGACLVGARLRSTNLRYANLVEADLRDADLADACVYGISAWGIKITDKTGQKNLVITPEGEAKVTTDDIEVAQFVYLLLKNEKIRAVIETVGKKGVLILGRFIDERKVVLDAIRNGLRERGFVPMMFDFERPAQRDFTETIQTLAGLSRFIIADITNPKSSPLELQAVMPNYMIPCVPIIQEGEEPFSMFRDLQQKYGAWVLDVLEYDSIANLMKVMDKAIVRPALEKSEALLIRKAGGIRKRRVQDYQEK